VLALSVCAVTNGLSEIKFEPTGQVRHRFEQDNRDLDADRASFNFNLLRTRLSGKFTADGGVTAFIQLQDSRVMGSEFNTLLDGSADAFDLHQGYLRIDKFFNAPINIKIGRFETKYGQERLIGAVDWTNTGRSFDGGVLNYHNSWLSLDVYAYAQIDSVEEGNRGDLNVYGFNGDIIHSESHTTQVYLIWQQATPSDKLSRATTGWYVKGELGDFSYRTDAAYQFGSITAGRPAVGDTVKHDVGAYMVTLDLWWNFAGSGGKPRVSAGVDYLSGDDDLTDANAKVFDTLYATNHRFYGFMDYFLDIPKHTLGRGLVDMHGRFVFTPWADTPIGLKGHLFQSAQDYTLSSMGTSKSFGSEIDLTLAHKYNKYITFVLGASAFFPGEIFKDIPGRGSETGYWGYIMTIGTI